eukprot:1517262-Pleurochrysis_carterae.AAC.1
MSGRGRAKGRDQRTVVLESDSLTATLLPPPPLLPSAPPASYALDLAATQPLPTTCPSPPCFSHTFSPEPHAPLSSPERPKLLSLCRRL